MEMSGGCGLAILFHFLQMRKHLLHDGAGERLGVHDHFRDGAFLSEVLIERTPRCAQLLEDLMERLDARLVSGIRNGADLLNLPTDRIKAGYRTDRSLRAKERSSRLLQ